MPFRFPSTRFTEPRTWSVGMGSIAVVMLLITCSQSGSFATSFSHFVNSTPGSEGSSGIASEEVFHVVRDVLVEQPGVIAEQVSSQVHLNEPLAEPEEAEVKDGEKRRFLEVVRQARFAELIGNNELSASLLLEAQGLLFGSVESE